MNTYYSITAIIGIFLYICGTDANVAGGRVVYVLHLSISGNKIWSKYMRLPNYISCVTNCYKVTLCRMVNCNLYTCVYNSSSSAILICLL